MQIYLWYFIYSDILYIYKKFLYSCDRALYCNFTQISASHWRNSM